MKLRAARIRAGQEFTAHLPAGEFVAPLAPPPHFYALR